MESCPFLYPLQYAVPGNSAFVIRLPCAGHCTRCWIDKEELDSVLLSRSSGAENI